jgi:hypothetical protein
VGGGGAGDCWKRGSRKASDLKSASTTLELDRIAPSSQGCEGLAILIREGNRSANRIKEINADGGFEVIEPDAGNAAGYACARKLDNEPFKDRFPWEWDMSSRSYILRVSDQDRRTGFTNTEMPVPSKLWLRGFLEGYESETVDGSVKDLTSDWCEGSGTKIDSEMLRNRS